MADRADAGVDSLLRRLERPTQRVPRPALFIQDLTRYIKASHVCRIGYDPSSGLISEGINPKNHGRTGVGVAADSRQINSSKSAP